MGKPLWFMCINVDLLSLLNKRLYFAKLRSLPKITAIHPITRANQLTPQLLSCSLAILHACLLAGLPDCFGYNGLYAVVVVAHMAYSFTS